MPLGATKKKKVVAVLQRTHEEVQQRIKERAYELFEERGREHGHDVDDWLRAETEVLNETTRNVA